MSRTEAERDLPPAVSIDLAQPLRSYWLDRARQHTWDSYAGVRISKFPEDLRVYEHLLWASRADAVIEIGAQFGGSALWFRDRLRTISQYRPIEAPRVVSIDIDITEARANIAAVDPDHEATITLIEATRATRPSRSGRSKRSRTGRGASSSRTPRTCMRRRGRR